MSSSGKPETLKVRILQAFSGRGGPQRRLKVGAGVILLGIIAMFFWSFWLGLLVVVLGVVVGGFVRGRR